MLKKNFSEAVARNKRFLKRQMMDGILLKTIVLDNPYAVAENRDKTWADRDCLALSDSGWIMKTCRYDNMVYLDVDDDTIPHGYLTSHFGESIYSALLGGNIRFVGNEYTTCSGAEPLICNIGDMDKLNGYENNHWVQVFAETAQNFAKETRADFWLRYFICIDALNLAVELLGSTQAYYMLYEDEALVRAIMEFGINFNDWFYRLQKSIYEDNNKAALEDAELYSLYDKTWYSIDAYDVCDPNMYKVLGFEYQQALISRVGGGMMHTHGTGLLKLLPHIAQLDGMGILQIGRDLYSQEELGIENLQRIREQTGDIPLQFSLSEHEFYDGIKGKTLPCGVEYICSAKTIDEANRMAYMAKGYHV